MMSRRFLYVVLNNYMHAPSAWYTLHRIDPSRLFYPNFSPGRPSPAREEYARLPDPAMSFYPPHSAHDAGSMDFALLGGSTTDRILAVDHTGRAVLYDDGSHAVHALPPMTAPKSCRTLSLAFDGMDGACVIETAPEADCDGQRSVEALVYSETEEDDGGWAWRPLPPPPYVHDPGYGKGDGGCSGEITCHAAEDARMWVTTKRRGTYCLDTTSGAWSKVGNWALPFRGRAVRLPEYGLWFGVSAMDAGHICASDLAAAAAATESRRPGADHAWEGFAVPEGFRELEPHSYLVHLGDHRFCMVKFFETTRGGLCECTFATFTGIEVVRADDHAGKWLRLIKHKSLRYSLGTDRLPVCVL